MTFFFALVVRRTNGTFSSQRYVVICGLSGCTTASHIISKTARFSVTTLLDIEYVL